MAGYSGTPLAKKLGIAEGAAVALVGAPAAAKAALAPLPKGAKIATSLAGAKPFDVIVFYTKKRAELDARFDGLVRRLDPAGGLWIAWPKKASKVPTDVTENTVREVALPRGLVDNKVCAIDDVWSGLRCVIRKENRPRAKKAAAKSAKPARAKKEKAPDRAALAEALFEAVHEGDAKAVRACIGRGADPNARNEEGELPIVIAAVEDDVAVVKALIAAGADPSMLDESAGWPPLFYAVQDDAVRVAKLLLRDRSAKRLRAYRDDRGWGLLAVAARACADACMKLLLREKPKLDIDGVDAEGRTPLAIASREAHVEVVERLLAHGANPDIADHLGMTPLMRAALVGSESTVAKILARGADRALRSREGKTAKDYASRPIAGL